MMVRAILLMFAMLLGAVHVGAEPIEWTDPTNQPVEFGTIRWSRNFNQALIKAHTEDRPLFILITPVDLNLDAKEFGKGPLSHPLINEALVTQFLPVAVIANGKDPEDARVIRSFNEKQLDQPIVHIVEPTRKEIAPKLVGSHSVSSVSKRMVSAMRARSQGVPKYLQLLAEAAEPGAPQLERAVFAMHCFWDGQARLGAIPGVIHANVGFLNNLEVVEVEFDPGEIKFEKLVASAQELECATKVFTRSDAHQEVALALVGSAAERSDEAIKPSPDDDLHWLMAGAYKSVPMTRLQALRVNASLTMPNEEPRIWLSSLQTRLLEKVQLHPQETWPVLAGRDDLGATWPQFMAFVEELGRKDLERRKQEKGAAQPG